MSRTPLGMDVFEAAIDRLASVYRAGHRVIVSFSGGKDSSACLELAILGAQRAGRGDEPVECVMRDDEIMLPGTFEFCERTAARPEVRFHWLVARQPVINIFNRALPYFWAFDPDLPRSAWVREYPDWAMEIDDKNIRHMVNPERFPPPPGREVVSIVGIRGEESHVRLMGIHSSGGFMTKPTETGVRLAKPIYDWRTGDIWRAHAEMGWDYNRAYDTMRRLGVPAAENRIGPPTQSMAAVPYLGLAAQAWPAWFRRVSERLPGIRAVAMFGRRAIIPDRRSTETYQDLYRRVCMDNSPQWIIDRATAVAERMVTVHARHSPEPFPDLRPCYLCTNAIGSWKRLTLAMVTGDPFSFKQNILPEMEPEFFRAGGGTWHPSKYGHKVAVD